MHMQMSWEMHTHATVSVASSQGLVQDIHCLVHLHLTESTSLSILCKRDHKAPTIAVNLTAIQLNVM